VRPRLRAFLVLFDSCKLWTGLGNAPMLLKGWTSWDYDCVLFLLVFSSTICGALTYHSMPVVWWRLWWRWWSKTLLSGNCLTDGWLTTPQCHSPGMMLVPTAQQEQRRRRQPLKLHLSWSRRTWRRYRARTVHRWFYHCHIRSALVPSLPSSAINFTLFQRWTFGQTCDPEHRPRRPHLESLQHSNVSYSKIDVSLAYRYFWPFGTDIFTAVFQVRSDLLANITHCMMKINTEGNSI